MKKSALDHWICKTEALLGLTREGLDALQLRRLNEILQRLRERGGFYKDYPAHLDSLEELKTLPFTTADMLAEHPSRFLLTSQSQVSRVISGATSGTTGPAKRVFYTETDTRHTIGFFAAGISEMLSAGETCIICFPFSGPFGLGDLIAAAVEQLGARPIRAGFGQSWGELAELVRKTQPEAYIGFPVTLLSLARLYGKDFPIQRALVSGDACPEGVMEALETCLGNPLYPHYGSREAGLGGAVTCPAFHGMHIRENHIIPEIIDAAGNVLPEGAFGELVITTIGLEAMPLIRYRTGDYTRLLPPCPCGSVTRRMDAAVRKEYPVSMAELDSLLFSAPELVDHSARWDGQLHVDARVANGNGAAVTAVLHKAYPGANITVTASTLQDRPMYLGKRYLIK